MTAIVASQVGRQVAISGLLPQTISFLLEYITRRADRLSSLLPDENGAGGDLDRLHFCLVNACLNSPEFSGLSRTRFIPYGCEEIGANPYAEAFNADLVHQPWQAERSAANASALILDWIKGKPIGQLERRHRGLRAGGINGLAGETSWALAGLANTLAVATRRDLYDAERPTVMRGVTTDTIANMRRLMGTLRLLIWRLNVGLPTEVLWMSELRTPEGRSAVSRNEALALHAAGLGSFEVLRQRNNWEPVIEALRTAGVAAAQLRAQLIQGLANEWRLVVRQRCRDAQIRRIGQADTPLLNSFYDAREKAFEAALEGLLGRAGIGFSLFDDGSRPGAFDYFIHVPQRPDLAFECKSKQGNGLVDLNSARVVLASSEQYGFGALSCVTVCQPGVDPNVPGQLQACGRLALVETHELAEGLVRVIQGRLTPAGFHDWLAQPGQARIEGLAEYAGLAPGRDG